MILGSIVANDADHKCVTDFGPQVQEQNKSISSSFDSLVAGGGDILGFSSYLPTEQKADGFENGEYKIIMFVTSGILLFVVTIRFYLFCWGCCSFGGCRKYNTTKREDFNSEHFYAHHRQVNDTMRQY